MIRPRTPRGAQLGEFLTAKRRAQPRAALGLPPGTRRTEVGLSREEVATLSGISVSWYTWLEQGRDINASHQVLAAVARVLQLTDSETDYVVALAGPGRAHAPRRQDGAPEHLLGLIRAIEFPAFILASDWSIVGWNSGYEWLYGSIATTPPEERNLLRLIYTDPRIRELLPDWERDSRSFLAEFRAEAGVRLSSEGHRALVETLIAQSPDFRAQWAEHAVGRFTSRRRTFLHPADGEIVFEHHSMVPGDAPELTVVMYAPSSAQGTAENTAPSQHAAPETAPMSDPAANVVA